MAVMASKMINDVELSVEFAEGWGRLSEKGELYKINKFKVGLGGAFRTEETPSFTEI